MKKIIIAIPILVLSLLLSTNTFANNIVPKKEKSSAFGAFLAKRNFMNASIADLEKTNGKHYTFIQRLGIKRLQHQIKKEFRKRNLLTGCDTLLLANGDTIFAVVSQVGISEINYKNCNDQNGPSFSVRKSDVAAIHFANGSIDYLERRNSNDDTRSVNAEEIKTDQMAIASIASSGLGTLLLLFSASGLGLIGLGLLVAGIVTGFMSRRRIKESNGKLRGKGFANAGIILGFSLLLLFLLLVILVVVLVISITP